MKPAGKTVSQRIAAVKYTAGQAQHTTELLALEEALQIKINAKPYTITMRTPGEDKNLAIGLLFTEGIIHTPEDIICITEIPSATATHTLMIDVGVKEEAIAGKNLFNRSIASSASCGVCGKIELCDLVAPEHKLITTGKLDIRIIPQLLQHMQNRQSAFEQTGGSHAAAIFTTQGSLLSIQEDIGRHNAVDKAIGELFLNKRLADAVILLVSGRVSYEVVAKCAQAGIPFLLAVSAPSSLAVDFCRRKGITLIGFCRDNRATVYTNEHTILQHHLPEQPAKQTA